MRNRLTGAVVAMAMAAAVSLTVTAQQGRQGGAAPAAAGQAQGRQGGAAAAQGRQGGAAAAQARPAQIAGRPNLNGIWQAINTANWNLEDHSASATAFWQLGDISAFPAGQSVLVDITGVIPYNPAGLKKRAENQAGWPKSDPEAKCYMPGL